MITLKEYLAAYKKYPWYSKDYTSEEEREADKEIIRTYNKALCDKYPWLIPRNRWTDKISEDFDYSYTEWDDIPEGWRLAFGDKFLQELGAEIARFNFQDEFRILQIKEKYSDLRVYTGGVPVGTLSEDYEVIALDTWGVPEYNHDTEDITYKGIDNETGKYIYHKHKLLDKCRIYDIINKYSNLSRMTCITCGKPAKWETLGYILPFCDECKQYMEKKEFPDRFMPIEEFYKKEE